MPACRAGWSRWTEAGLRNFFGAQRPFFKAPSNSIMSVPFIFCLVFLIANLPNKNKKWDRIFILNFLLVVFKRAHMCDSSARSYVLMCERAFRSSLYTTEQILPWNLHMGIRLRIGRDPDVINFFTFSESLSFATTGGSKRDGIWPLIRIVLSSEAGFTVLRSHLRAPCVVGKQI